MKLCFRSVCHSYYCINASQSLSVDPVGDIMNNMTNKRSKPAIMKKLLEMGVVSDKRELYKKRSKNPSKKKRSAQDWLEENEIEDVPIPSDRDEGRVPRRLLMGHRAGSVFVLY